MNKSILLLLIITAFLSNTSWSQDSTHVIAQYNGGRFGYSWTSLTLRSDSSYTYTSSSHNRGGRMVERGSYHMNDSTISLYSRRYNANTGKRKPKMMRKDDCMYRKVKNTILMYTQEQEKNSESDYYRVYHTLYLSED